MALKREDREIIVLDLVSLCRYETEEAISGRRAEKDLFWRGSPINSALRARENAERRLEYLPEMIKSNSHEMCLAYEQIQECIKQLNEYIAEKEGC